MEIVSFQHAAYFAVFDGHGGREAAEYAANHIHSKILEKLEQKRTIEESIETTFLEVKSEMSAWCVYSGTTVLIALLFDRNLWIANLGDSRAILSRDGEAIVLSHDHKPTDPDELKRIQSDGGFVKDGRVNGILGVARALGDDFLKKAVSAVPFISNIKLTDSDECLVLACDGVWDVFNNQQVVDIVMSEIDPQKAAAKLRDEAYSAGSTDNISVVVVFLK